jgi:hypothetical protein
MADQLSGEALEAIRNLPDPYPERRLPEYCWRSWPPRHTDECGCHGRLGTVTVWIVAKPGSHHDLPMFGTYFDEAEARAVAQRAKAALIALPVAEDYREPSGEDRIRDAMAEAQDHPGRVVTR